MITTANAEWDTQFRLLRQHAMSVPDTVRHAANKVVFESYPVLGYNYRMTDIQAAIGREQLKRLPGIVLERRRLAQRYEQLLTGIQGLQLPREPAWARSNWQSYCVRLPSGCDQRTVMQHMLDAGISTRRGIMCSHLEDTYRHRPENKSLKLPHSEEAQRNCILLPLFPGLGDEQQQMVASTLKTACQ
jgi:dTDP-4-amino-4,6-dideoxygalactose transaminase